VCSCTCQREGKITKSAVAVPGIEEGHVNTVKILGSGWSNETELIVQNLSRSYLNGT